MNHSFIVTILVIAIATIIMALEPNSSEQLAYYRTGISQGEVWRLLTASLCHTNWYHLLFNGVGFITIYCLFKQHLTKTIIPLLLVISTGLGICLYWLNPELVWYVGLSGTLHGIFVYGCILDIKTKVRFGWILLLGAAAKIISEQLMGGDASVSALIEAEVLVDAHLYGALIGLILALIQLAAKLTRHTD